MSLSRGPNLDRACADLLLSVCQPLSLSLADFLFLVGSLALLLSYLGVIETMTKQVFHSFFGFH